MSSLGRYRNGRVEHKKFDEEEGWKVYSLYAKRETEAIKVILNLPSEKRLLS